MSPDIKSGSRPKRRENVKGQPTRLCHFDFYRLKDEKEASELGLEEYLGRSNLICVIEWADKIAKILPEERLMIEFDFVYPERSRRFDENKRKIIFRPEGRRYEKMVKKMVKDCQI